MNKFFRFSSIKFSNILIILLMLLSLSVNFANEKETESKTNTETKSNYPPDMVKDLKFKILNDGNTVELNWIPPEEEGEIIIARSDSIIDTPEKLYISDSLGRFPTLKTNPIKEFKDLNVKPGKHYYAIIMVKKVKSKSVELLENVNFTTTPAEIGVNKGETENTPKEGFESLYSITNIHLNHHRDYNQISWTPPMNFPTSKPTYHIYRSTEPLSSIPLLKKSTKLIELNFKEVTFIDKNIDPEVPYYYGVSVSIKDKEYVPLTEGISFARVVFPGSTEIADKPNSNPGGFDPNSKNENNQNVTNNINIDSGKVENTGEKEKTEENKEEKSETKSNIPEKSVEDLNYEYYGKGITLVWKAPDDSTLNSTVYSIYKSESNLKHLEKNLQKGKAIKLGEVNHPDITFTIPKIDRKKIVYYGVTVKDSSGKEYFQLLENESFIKVNPDRIADKSKETETKENSPTQKNTDSGMEFKKIMTDYYKKGNYHIASKKFLNLAFRETDSKLKAKSLFYAALSNYQLKRYDYALKLLLKKDLKENFNKERVDFYINRCIERRSN